MPRNPIIEATERAKVAESNYRAAEKALAQALDNRKKAMVSCRKAGMTFPVIAKIFGVSPAQISNVVHDSAKR